VYRRGDSGAIRVMAIGIDVKGNSEKGWQIPYSSERRAKKKKIKNEIIDVNFK